ncbi:DUF1080 domain-containing protein [Algoriphagus sp. D3-2-R+10]|uniref:3-keto-disaccharide hydrolase n=1 Tax=Algoriphagus aurantiacus TaxID=3103948 RepID=UPI002B3A9EA3|nr:DUF1080 domain-containing protein [Algoriphagus sp. D3-2-R+10]MEB2775103.1 DUF1080 domain-containing protein [Algoriphagus sp. D3-2-R+10]
MKSILTVFSLISLTLCGCSDSSVESPVSLFDGKSLSGWQGDTVNTWRVEDGMIIGGSLDETVPNNEFLVTGRTYENFILTLKIKLTGDDGFINSGIQFHSKRLKDPDFEMEGYQADWGEGYWASLYDESRRNVTLIAPDSAQVLQWIKIDDWNDYKVHTENGRIQLFINGNQTVDYTEKDKSIPQSGLIGLQIHGGGKAQVAFKNIFIEELPQKE